MKRAALPFAAILTLAAIAVPAGAQAPSAGVENEASPEVEAIFATIPDTLLGATGQRQPGEFFKSYLARDMVRDPSLGVTVTLSEPATEEAWRQHVRGMFQMTHVIREGMFTSARMPGATGYFGEYLTATGLKQSWMIEQDGVRLSALVTFISVTLAGRRAARLEIADKVFNGRTDVADEAPLPRNVLTRGQNR